jgi:hypothetical protein
MQRNNTRLIGFNVARVDSPDARKAYETFARQTDGLLAILVFQYDGYEAGAGKIFWTKDRHGLDVPVVSARYSIWSQANRPRVGTPAKIAREIQQTVESSLSPIRGETRATVLPLPKREGWGEREGAVHQFELAQQLSVHQERRGEKSIPSEFPRYDWVIAHVWSWFKHAPGSDDHAEDMPQENAPAQGGVRGYTPVTWSAARLPSNIRTVSPDELIWRIRMQHNPEQTKKLILAYSPVSPETVERFH